MSDEAQAPVGETPGVDDTPNGTVAEQINWEAKARELEQRYQNLQPEYTRTTQELARYRDLQSDDPEARARAAEALGLQFADDDDEDDEYVDPTSALSQRLEALESTLAQERQKAQEDAHVAQVEALIDQQVNDLGLSGARKDWVISRAFAMPFTEQGVPDIKGAFTEFQDALQVELQKEWKNSKRAAHVSSVGTSATQVPNLDNEKERQHYMLERMKDISAGS